MGELVSGRITNGNNEARLKDVTPENTTVNTTERIPVKLQREKLVCSISGIDLLDSDHLVTVDCQTNSVKRVSLRQKTVTHYLPLDGMPWDITKVNMDTLAITMPWESLIQFVSVSESGTLSLGVAIQSPADCRGIQYIDEEEGRMIVSRNSRPASIHVIDMNGHILKEMSVGTGLESLRPMYLTLSRNYTVMYVPDKNNNTVTAMGIDGTILFTYRDDHLEDPRGVAVGSDGEIYICGSKSNNIHMVSSTGKNIKILLEEKDGVISPESIIYDTAGRKLYIGMEHNNSIHVFTLT